MRPKSPITLNECNTSEELFDARIMWFLLDHKEPSKNFRKDGSYVGRLSDYFKDLKGFCQRDGFSFHADSTLPYQESIEKFFYAFFRGVFKKGSCAERHFINMFAPPDFLMDTLVKKVNGKLVICDNDINGLAFKEAFLYTLGYRKTDNIFC